MSIIVVSSLKGGVGKTSLAINASHALASRGCEVLLVDLDPQTHASHLLTSTPHDGKTAEPLAGLLRAWITAERERKLAVLDDIQDRFCEEAILQLQEVRPSFSLLSLGAAFQGELVAAPGTPLPVLTALLSELTTLYDYVVVDTAPAWGRLLDSALQAAAVVVIPVDPSSMSIRAAGELLTRGAQRGRTPVALVRTMVHRQAPQIAAVSEREIHKRLTPRALEDVQREKPYGAETARNDQGHRPRHAPILLKTIIHRSEQLHRLGFLKKTVFDLELIPRFQESYRDLAKELEAMLALADSQSTAEPLGLDLGAALGKVANWE